MQRHRRCCVHPAYVCAGISSCRGSDRTAHIQPRAPTLLLLTKQPCRSQHGAAWQKVPFLLEDKLKEDGAIYTKGQDWHSHAVFDGNLVTGAISDACMPRRPESHCAQGLAKPAWHPMKFRCVLQLVWSAHMGCVAVHAGQNPQSSPAVGQLILEQL